MKILLVEDEPDLGRLVQKNLTSHHYVVDLVADGKTAWNYLTNSESVYSLAIIDWMLPKLSGLELCQKLRSEHYTLPILMLTARDRMEDKIAGLDAGADDYLVKPFGMEELLARLRALQRRLPTFKPNHLQIGNLRLDYTQNALAIIPVGDAKSARLIPLTAKEFQLLEYLMQHPDITLTQEQIRNRIWAFDRESSSNVVAAQIRLLRKKLAEFGYDHIINTVRGFGYRFHLPIE
jgi:DNA-binding response OmpR family regulator